MTRTYALITPARDEADNLRRLADSILAQAVQPDAWIIVDNGSADGTLELARELERQREWIQAVSAPGSRTAAPGQPIVRAFHRGLRQLPGAVDVLIKVDADVSMDPIYFDRLLAAFDADSSLGIASGSCYEHEAGAWRATRVTGDHVRGATRAYRWECLQAVLPLEERVGWDTIDELKAAVLGWRTGIVSDLPFYHHRRVGQRDGRRWSRWATQGRAAYYIGYRFPYLLLRSIYRARTDPVALAMVGGYLSALARREGRCSDAAVRRNLRRQQGLRQLPSRIREALGRSVAGR